MRFFKDKDIDAKKIIDSTVDKYHDFERATLSHAQKYLVRRWVNFKEVGIPALIWLLLVIGISIGVNLQSNSLDAAYKTDIPAEGGTYSEGIVGNIENVNPLYANSNAEREVSRLLFAGLLQYDERNELVGDLAERWTVSEDGDVYRVALRDDLIWSDGSAITSEDIIFTIKTIQDEAVGSPLASSWEKVKVKVINDTTVEFILPSTFAPFAHSLTLGILPEHILGDVPPAQLRTSEFNSSPGVVSGPFALQDVRNVMGRTEARLIKRNSYFKGDVKLDRFTLYAYDTYEEMIAAFSNHEISAAGGVRVDDLQSFSKDSGVVVTDSPLAHGAFAFFNNSRPLLGDTKVRRALSLATDRNAVASSLGDWYDPIGLPLLPGHLGYDKSIDKMPYNVKEANTILYNAGWAKNSQGIREKDGKPLELNLVASATEDYPKIAAELQRQWQDNLGVVIKTNLVQPSEFQQNILIPHNYDILLYELAIGADPDVYLYWHSSQARERGLNLSEYSSSEADIALESGRNRVNEALRAAKYKTFLEVWSKDYPAVALYQPGYGYVYRTSVSGFLEHELNSPTDHIFNIEKWTANTRDAVTTH